MHFDTAVSMKKMQHAEVIIGNCRQIISYPKSSKNEEVHFFNYHTAWGNVCAYMGCTFVSSAGRIFVEFNICVASCICIEHWNWTVLPKSIAPPLISLYFVRKMRMVTAIYSSKRTQKCSFWGKNIVCTILTSLQVNIWYEHLYFQLS